MHDLEYKELVAVIFFTARGNAAQKWKNKTFSLNGMLNQSPFDLW